MIPLGWTLLKDLCPLLQKIKSALLSDIPVAVNYRINAGAIPSNTTPGTTCWH